MKQCNPAVAYRAFSHDVTATMLVFENKEMSGMMVYQTNPAGIELYFYANTVNTAAIHVSENAPYLT